MNAMSNVLVVVGFVAVVLVMAWHGSRRTKKVSEPIGYADQPRDADEDAMRVVREQDRRAA